MCRWPTVFASSILFVLLAAAHADPASPRLARFIPGAVPLGRTVEVVLEGERMEDPLDLHFYEQGIKAIEFKEDGDLLRVKLQVDAHCRTGEHVGHLRTRKGITEYRPLYVIPMDTGNEKETNDSIEESQTIEMNKAYCGRLLNGDRDFFALDIIQPTVLTLEVLAMRLGNTALDCVVTLLSESGKSLKSSTGHQFSVNDPIMQFDVKTPGRYYIEIRELLGGGNEHSQYVLCVGSFPRPLALFPPGGPLSEHMNVQCLGDMRGKYAAMVNTPSHADRHHSYAPIRGELRPPTPIPFRLSRHANFIEEEPNNTLSASNGTDIEHAFCGTISEPGDEDWYQFDAVKGESLDINVYARRVRSSLDSTLAIFDKDGQQIEINDDGGKVTEHSDADDRGTDSFIRFNPPMTMKYYLRISDTLGTGGLTHVYRVECVHTKPWMIVRLPRVQDPNELYGQYRQQIFIARGNRFAALARARTRGFSGRLTLEFPQLPEGVSYETQNIPAGTTGFPIVFTAADEAPLGGGLYPVRGAHEEPEEKIEGGYYNYADLLRAKANLSLLKTRIVEKLPIVVTDSLPYRLEGYSPGTPIVRKGVWKLKVKVVRDDGFNDPIRLTMPFLPPGVATSSGEVIPAGETEAEFRLTAHPKITPRDWKIYVQGVSGEENNWMWASTQLIPLTVEKGFASLSLSSAEALVGQDAFFNCEITTIKEFEGEARIELSGLPEHVVCAPISFKSSDERIKIPIHIGSNAEEGSYQGIRANLYVPYRDNTVVSEFGPTTLTIGSADKQKEDDPVVAEKPTSDAVPLSALEQLRFEAKKRSKANREVAP